MKLIVGIGNPGAKYLNTRHNIGFQILDSFCEKHKLEFKPAKSNFWFVESKFDTFHFFLVKPTTYVNNTGLAVKEVIDSYNIDLSDILIIYDDINLETGKLRIRKSGSDGGHNGIKSIFYHLKENNFARLRIGISKNNDDYDLADYVLSDFSKDEIEIIKSEVPFIIELIEHFISGGTQEMLDHFSKKSQINS